MQQHKWQIRKDFEMFKIPIGKKYLLKCCDCGLEHKVVWLMENGKLYMTAVRNNKVKLK
jgi:hypothetical protein